MSRTLSVLTDTERRELSEYLVAADEVYRLRALCRSGVMDQRIRDLAKERIKELGFELSNEQWLIREDLKGKVHLYGRYSNESVALCGHVENRARVAVKNLFTFSPCSTCLKKSGESNVEY